MLQISHWKPYRNVTWKTLIISLWKAFLTLGHCKNLSLQLFKSRLLLVRWSVEGGEKMTARVDNALGKSINCVSLKHCTCFKICFPFSRAPCFSHQRKSAMKGTSIVLPLRSRAVDFSLTNNIPIDKCIFPRVPWVIVRDLIRIDGGTLYFRLWRSNRLLMTNV